jgi:hypothetical protein
MRQTPEWRGGLQISIGNDRKKGKCKGNNKGVISGGDC